MKFSECEKWLKEVGLATVLPGKTALPCLLWQVQGHRGPFSGWDEAFQKTWSWKDELPARGLAWAGHLFGSQVLLIHVRLLPIFLGARGALDVEELYEEGNLSQPAVHFHRMLARSKAPLGRAELRKALKLKPAEFDKAAKELERLLVITRCGAVTQGPGWGSNSYSLVDRHFPGLKPPTHGAARTALRQALQHAAPEATDAQLTRWLRAIG